MNGTKKILITGGVRSGKSRTALDLALRRSAPRIFIATAQAFDDGMRLRIENHRKERNGFFETQEEPVHLGENLKTAHGRVIVVDCLTVWINNLLFRFPDDPARIEQEIKLFMDHLMGSTADVIMVTNEVGLGVMPENALARRYTDLLGSVNQQAAAICSDVILMVSGIPQYIKGIDIYGHLDRQSETYTNLR